MREEVAPLHRQEVETLFDEFKLWALAQPKWMLFLYTTWWWVIYPVAIWLPLSWRAWMGDHVTQTFCDRRDEDRDREKMASFGKQAAAELAHILERDPSRAGALSSLSGSQYLNFSCVTHTMLSVCPDDAITQFLTDLEKEWTGFMRAYMLWKWMAIFMFGVLSVKWGCVVEFVLTVIICELFGKWDKYGMLSVLMLLVIHYLRGPDVAHE